MREPRARRSPAAGSHGRERLRLRHSRREGQLLVSPALVILALFYLAPSLYNVVLSLQHITLFQTGGKGGTWAGLSNFADVLSDEQTWQALVNTGGRLTAVTVVGRLVLGMALALMINSAIVRRRYLTAVARSLVILPWAVPPIVAAALWRFLLDPRDGALSQLLAGAGLSDSGIAVFQQVSTVWYGLDALVVWRELPFVVLMLLAGLQTIPRELYEAAAIDGAGRYQQFRHITLPMLRPIVLVVAVLTTIWTFNNFVYVWIATKGGPGTYTEVLGTALYRDAFVKYDVGRSSALSVLASLLVLVLALLYFAVVKRPKGKER